MFTKVKRFMAFAVLVIACIMLVACGEKEPAKPVLRAPSEITILVEDAPLEKATSVDGDDIVREIGYSGTEDQLRWIKKKVKETGPGSAYLCTVCWKGTRNNNGGYDAHVFCIVNDGGKVKFYDPQTGQECSSYFTNKQIVPKETEIFRADNCRLNGTMMKEVVDYEKAI